MNTLEYYSIENCEKIFNAIENPQWRIFKSVDSDGLCRQNKKQITTPQKLFDFIHQCKNPQKLYVSSSTFLNPHKNHGNFKQQKIIARDGHYFYPKAGYIYADCILMDSHFYADFDCEKDLRIAQEDARKVINLMQANKDFELDRIQFSGVKGINLLFKQIKKRKINDPIKRIQYYHKQKEALVNAISKLNLKTIDKNHINIMADIFRVHAATYSIKPNGNIVTPISKDDFMNEDIYKTLSFEPPTVRRKKASEGKPNDKKVASDGEQSSSQPYRNIAGIKSIVPVEERASLISSRIFFRFLDNMVNGLKDTYVAVIKKNRDKFSIRELKELQKTYHLSDFHIYQIGNYIYSYNFKLMQYERMVKILRKAKSQNLNYFLTRRHLPIQISDSIYEDGSIANRREHIGILKSEYGLNDFHSKPHCEAFNASYNKMAGSQNKVGVMRVS